MLLNSLKIKREDMEQLRAAVAPLDTLHRRAKYWAGDFPNADRCKNLDMRYRWDLLNDSGLKIGDGIGVSGNIQLYSYLDDTHIDSALKHLIPKLESPSPVYLAATAAEKVLTDAIKLHEAATSNSARVDYGASAPSPVMNAYPLDVAHAHSFALPGSEAVAALLAEKLMFDRLAEAGPEKGPEAKSAPVIRGRRVSL